MRQLTWDEFYSNFYDWAPSTQKSYASRLIGYGPSAEVTEIIHEFIWNDEAFAAKFLSRALEAGACFTPEQVLEFASFFDKPLVTQMAKSTTIPFTRDELEEIYTLIDDAVFEQISQRQNIDIFAEDEIPESDTEADYEEEASEPPTPRLGFWGTLAAVFAGSSILGGGNKKVHSGHCDGDCANCPPHYGYRYGRWYYGHGHAHGCEFGGNKGDGSL